MNGVIKISEAGTSRLGDRTVKRLGHGAMHLAGPGVLGPPEDRDAAAAVPRAVLASGVEHIDASDYCGAHVTTRLIREAPHRYPDDLFIVRQVGARRNADASWIAAMSPADLTSAGHDNQRNLGVDVLDVVNLRFPSDGRGPAEGSIEESFAALAEQQGLVGGGPPRGELGGGPAVLAGGGARRTRRRGSLVRPG